MGDSDSRYDVVMLGTFSPWKLGTLQARALPFAIELNRRGIRCAIVTVPWDQPGDRGTTDVVSRVPVLNTRSASVYAVPLAVSQQLALVNRLRPRLIHLFKPKGFGGLSASVLRHARPLVVDSDDWEGDGGWNRAGQYGLLQRRVFEWQERMLQREAHAVTAASTLLARRARQVRRRPDDDSVWSLPNGLAADWYEALAAGRAQAVREPRDPVPTILLYSRFAEFGPTWVPRFVARLAQHVTDPVRVRLVGDSSPMLWEDRLVEVESMGYVAKTSLPETLAAAGIAVFPYDDSLIARSKQSVKLLELMAAGCALVATDAGDVARTVGSAGALIRSSSPEAFADAVLRLAAAPSLVRDLGADATRRVNMHFRVAALTPTLIAAYDQVNPSSGR